MSYSEPLMSGSEAATESALVHEGDQVTQPPEDLSHEEEKTTSHGGLKSIVYEIVETVLLAVGIWLAVNLTTARYVVEGDSMKPNLHTGQFLIVNRLAYLQVGSLVRLGSIQRGDIVVFDFPGNPADDYVKRIIGMPGETVRIDENGTVFINDVPLEEPYVAPEMLVPYRNRTGTWIVSEDSYFVLGDNRNSSSDSRSWGMLEEKYIVGKAWVSYWPPQYWGVIPHYVYSTVASGGDRP